MRKSEFMAIVNNEMQKNGKSIQNSILGCMDESKEVIISTIISKLYVSCIETVINSFEAAGFISLD